MRFLALSPVVVALGFGGGALAQPAELVDPWARAPGDADAWFGAEATPEPSVADPEIEDPWAAETREPAPVPAPAPAAKPVEVAAVKPAAAPVPAIASGLDDRGVRLVDPWAAPATGSETPSLNGAPPAPARARSPSWSDPYVEVVDPWKRKTERGASERVRLFVDPWAR